MTNKPQHNTRTRERKPEAGSGTALLLCPAILTTPEAYKGDNMSDKPKKRRGRPSVITPEIIDKLDYAFSIGCNDSEAISFAGISKSAFYNYLDKHADYKERKEALKLKPILKAKKANNDLIESGDPVHIRWYLERKKADEFSSKAEVNIDSSASLSLETRSQALSDFLSQFLDD